jgi:hypothetical protein
MSVDGREVVLAEGVGDLLAKHAPCTSAVRDVDPGPRPCVDDRLKRLREPLEAPRGTDLLLKMVTTWSWSKRETSSTSSLRSVGGNPQAEKEKDIRNRLDEASRPCQLLQQGKRIAPTERHLTSSRFRCVVRDAICCQATGEDWAVPPSVWNAGRIGDGAERGNIVGRDPGKTEAY